MSTILIKTASFIFFLCITLTATSQNIPKYDYLEVIVIQKANNRGKVKRIKVEEQTSLVGKQITIKQLEDLEKTSDLLNYMNAANWEFVDRQSIVSEENDPVWMSYIFRKKK
ncbi:hypothetical protein IWQ47_003289 [Aquimarina sp. EL_43]|uniref:hypothetical protein n=1 Tax=Aquimarina TaxID=290174 RepID=UPI000471E313|nr:MULTISPECIES: hypothetical protein [Aquimarina]MBG6131969.1 hypothetical protein [Aquimarina sp. EL_35]MBG6149533.1 hypothetical protein [Aquimarina sp. EL_32]MBG6170204.1 hypothetical protein [Aquimarina sp. EL_43]